MVRALLAAIVLISFPLASTAQTPKRVVLVIGNSAYQHTTKLDNPRNDATDIAAALKKHAFHVIQGFDLDKAAMEAKIREFAEALRGAPVAAFFYAGHGLQVGGQNYLMPVDAKLTTAAALDWEMVRLDLVHRSMEREAATSILFIDACRTNPLARNLARALGTRSAEIGRGLAQVEAGVGTLVSFSTQPGNYALDGTGRNSPFAGALARHVATSRDDLGAILIAVRNDVMKETQRKQVPWEHSALTGRFFFDPSAAVRTDQHAYVGEAERAWAAAQGTKSVAVLDDFIARYKSTFYAGLARERMEELKRQEQARKAADEARRKIEQAKRDFSEAERHLQGRAVPVDNDKARELLEKAAAAGNAAGMNALGNLYLQALGVPRHYGKARGWYEKAAAAGSEHGMHNLGLMYQNGRGVAQDYVKAHDWFTRGAAAGNGTSMANLGWLYRQGWGVPRDYDKARAWFEKAVALGNGTGLNNLGVLYEHGQGVAKDYAKARELYEKAAAVGNDFGMNNLGRFHGAGRGVPQDYAKAREWYEKAAAAGNSFGKGNLAGLLDRAQGGAADFPRAARLVLEAASRGNADILQDLRGAMKEWTPGTRTELKRELARLGHYSGSLDDKWDDRARSAIDKYLAERK